MNKIKTLFNQIIIGILALTTTSCTAMLFAISAKSFRQDHAKLEKNAHDLMASFAKKYQGGVFGVISVGSLTSEHATDSFGIWVTAKTKETIQTGRELAVGFVKAYLNELQTTKEITEYYEFQCKKWPQVFSGPMEIKNIALRIAFWDEKVELQRAPYLAEIDFRNETFQYYQADPKKQGLVLVLEESYHEALTDC